MIHPTALVSPQARLGQNVTIGPFCVVEHDVEIGDDTILTTNVVVHRSVTIGAENEICAGAVLGGKPQHLNQDKKSGRLVIGRRNTIREHVTIHRALRETGVTSLGDDCLLMVGAHVAHDCQIGDGVILTNGVMLGGHVRIGNRACLGGNAAVHQLCRIGRLAMVGGCTKVVQDIPPFVLTDGPTAMIVGLNRIGLRRAGFTSAEVLQLKQAYRLIYRAGLTFSEMLAALEEQFPTGYGAEFAEFFHTGTRGFVQERRSPPKVALRVHPAVDDVEIEPPQVKPYRRAA